MTHIPKHETHEGTGGWKDGRLGQAYDLIDAVIADQADGSPVIYAARAARDAVEATDVELEKIL